ncbi:hypothetical protein ASPVEDRAFT_78549 [Aspergillus versicolor CBS 583.65]|uniref:Methyltransferase type 11 domain-containing protein n=1 Tax=Aspergillus versicolor CBS 583.65 TaxID=1036611 RepID=A0A1L9P5L7_ASPVE|nr:uncharacterized protein ASPVEDRAFT_78549 [Aspergillus versicolor CBS 583.65]OJI96798.1 hypothetical protein ASPVEDRAFT_78549 [Aspergillus versicolor CBS 583.65]
MAQTIQEALAHRSGRQTTPEGQRVEYLNTVEAYDKWAEVYDTDGNFLQALDTVEMKELLPRFLGLVRAQDQTEIEPGNHHPGIKLVDLGCGTGRNTLQLAKSASKDARIIGLDASSGMLGVAREALRSKLGIVGGDEVTLDLGDGASGLISTLVLEHIPGDKFFEGAARLIKPGGYFLVTNMHTEMGTMSQAGFVDAKTGKKIRPTSYAHKVDDVVVSAERFGFEPVALDEGGQRVRERSVDEAMVEGLGERAKKWVGVTVWFGICFRMRVD